MNAPVRVGVIGVGVMGQHHARNYAHMASTELVGVVDADTERASLIADRCGTQSFAGVDALLAEGLDAVSIAVPTSDHHETALACLEADAHCLVEKPLASTLEQCREINELASRNGLLVMVGHIERFNPAVTALKDIIDFGTLGPIRGLSTLRVGPRPERITDAGILLDVGCHDIDLLTWLTGTRASEIRASVVGPDAGRGADAATIQMEFGLLKPGVAEMSWQYKYKNRRLTVQWEHCEALLDFMRQQLILSNTIGATKVPVSKAEPLRRELEAFIGAIRRGGSSPVPGSDAFYTLQVIETAQSSAMSPSNEWIVMPEEGSVVPAEVPMGFPVYAEPALIEV